MHTTKHLFLLLVCVLSLFSCSGNIDYDDPDNVPEGVLRIFADKTTIKADGQQIVTFTVRFGSKDVSTDRSMNISYYVGDDETSLKPGVNTFTTTSPADYRFKARYYSGGAHYTDNEVAVKAVSVSQGVGQKDWYRKLWGMQFTAVSCTYCPRLTASLKTVMSEDPGRIVLTAFHVYFGWGADDPMCLDINEEFRNIVKHGEGLPLFAFDMYRSEDGIVDELEKIRTQKTAMLEDFPATCGVAVSAQYDAAKSEVTVTGRVTSNVAEVMRYHIILVEDGIEYAQMGAEDDTYVHNNVVRAVAAENKWGDRLNGGIALEEGVEVTVNRTIKLESGWKPENMRAVFVALSEEGDTFIANNVNECALDASSDYEYNL